MTRYSAKNKSIRDHIEYSIKRLESLRDGLSLISASDVKKIKAAERRAAGVVQKELDRRATLEASHCDFITPETYRRYVGYVRACVKKSAIKDIKAIKTLVDLAPNNTLKKMCNEYIITQNTDLKKPFNKILSKANTGLKSAKKEATVRSYTDFISFLESQDLSKDCDFVMALVMKESVKKSADSLAIERVKKYQMKSNDRLFKFEKIHTTVIKLLGASASSGLADIVKETKRGQPIGVWGLALGVSLATGRRGYEVIHLSEFKAISKHEIKISGLAKKGSEEGLGSVVVPTIVDAYAIEEAVKKIRSDSRVQHIRAATRAARAGLRNATYSQLTKDHLRDVAAIVGRGLLTTSRKRAVDMRFKDARDIYVVSAFEAYRANGGKMKITRYIQEKLGHESIETALNYEKFSPHEAVSRGDVMRAQQLEVKKERRDKKLRSLLESKACTANKSFVKISNYLIQQLDEIGAKDLIISTKMLRNVQKENGKIGAIARSEAISAFMKIIKDKKLDMPA